MNVLSIRKILIDKECCQCKRTMKLGIDKSYYLLEIKSRDKKVERALCSTNCLHAEVQNKSVDSTIAGIYINKYN